MVCRESNPALTAPRYHRARTAIRIGQRACLNSLTLCTSDKDLVDEWEAKDKLHHRRQERASGERKADAEEGAIRPPRRRPIRCKRVSGQRCLSRAQS